MLNYSSSFLKFIAFFKKLFTISINSCVEINSFYLLFNANIIALFNSSFLLLSNILTARCFFTIFFRIFNSIFLNINYFREIICERLLFNLLLKYRRLSLINTYYKERETLAIPAFRKIYFNIFIIRGGSGYIPWGCAASG